jgi:hypothetical protein
MFSYPLPPASDRVQAKFSAFGVIGDKMVKTAETLIDTTEEDIFLLASNDGVQVVSRQAVVAEDDPLAQRLQRNGARPAVKLNGGLGAVPAPESDRGPQPADNQSISVDLPVQLVPQPTPVTCWAASLAMVAGYRDSASYSADTIAAAAGMDTIAGYSWADIQKAVTTWNLQQEGPTSAMPSAWADLLRTWGPIWIVEVGAPYHAVVVGGLQGDGTPESTDVTVYNPWPPGQGAVETKTFLAFDQEYGLGAGAGAMLVHA